MLNVASYNLLCPVAPPFRYTGQVERMERLPGVVAEQLDRLARVDVLVVQESMVPAQHAVLSRGLHGIGFVHETPPLVGRVQDLKVVHGGLVCFSRWPLVRQRTHIFDGPCVGADCLAAKGCGYVQLDKAGQAFHVVYLHLQAWETPKARLVRRSQVQQIAAFIAALDVPADAPLVVLGDYNMDLYSQRDQLVSLVDQLGCALLPRHPQSHPFSSDPMTNQLMGIDDDLAYASDAFPAGCGDQYRRTLTCACCPQEWLDYVTVSRRHLPHDPSRSWMRIVPAKAREPFEVRLTVSMRRRIRDLSDHYPVLGQVVFPSLLRAGDAPATPPWAAVADAADWAPVLTDDPGLPPFVLMLLCTMTALVLLTVLILGLRTVVNF